MKTKHGVDPLILDADLYDAINDFTDDIPFYMKWARGVRGGVLEMCCGSGRVTVPLKLKGVDITGVDFTSSMLTAAKRKARLAGAQISFFKQDIRKMKLGRKYGLIIIPFHSLQNIYELDDLEQVFDKVKVHLRPKGRFIIAVTNPAIAHFQTRIKSHFKRYDLRIPKWGRVQVFEKARYDNERQIMGLTWSYVINRKHHAEQNLSMRCYFPQELAALLKYNGFTVERRFGDYDGSPFKSTSPQQILVCRKSQHQNPAPSKRRGG